MKKLIKLFIASALLLSIFGCATPSSDEKYETRLRPSEDFNPIWLRYQEQPGQKIMVIAIDMDNNWAYGYDHGRDTLTEAAETATIKCDKAREKHKVFTKSKLFAVNNDIIYYDKQFK